MCKKLTYFLMVTLMLLGISSSIQAQATTYAYNASLFSYGYIDLTTAAFTSLNFSPEGFNYYPVAGDNIDHNLTQYAVFSDFSYPQNYFLEYVDFNAFTGDSIGAITLAAGQTIVRGFAHNAVTDTWYMISSDDFGVVPAVLYTVDITTGATTVVANLTDTVTTPVALAIDCDGNAYIVSAEAGAGMFDPSQSILYSLDLTTGVATQIGTTLGLDGVFGLQDMDFDPSDGQLYWSAYWSSGFFNEGGSFRVIDVSTGTSTEIGTFGQFENIIGLGVIGTCTIVPVELTSFSANVSGGSVVLDWSTATELNNSGFEIERKSQNTDWTRIGFVSGSGSTTEIRKYTYSDNSVTSGSYSYRLKQVDFDGTFEYSQELNVDVTPAVDYALNQNYPNPFNPTTKIRFSVPQASVVKLTIYNAIGEAVKDLVNNYYEVGSHEVIFNASNLASGIYFVKMESGSFVSTRKITLLK